MALADLSDWLDEYTGPDIIWYVKRLSANDTGANRTHQAGPHITKDFLFQVFPELNRPDDENPRVVFDLHVDSHADCCEVTAIWYNGKKLGHSTRNEARLTGFGGKKSALLTDDNTGALTIFAFRLDRIGAATNCHAWVCDSAVEEYLVEGRIGTVAPGKHLVWPPHQVPPTAFSAKSCWLEPAQMPPGWLHTFPTGAEIVRKTIELRPMPNIDADIRLLKRSECEFELFRSIEKTLELPRIHTGFNTIDEFTKHALSILQRRKSRAGRSLELHVREIFMEEGLNEDRNFSYQPITELNKQPDFLFPSRAAYQDSGFPEHSLRMLAVKTTCKDRWRQIINEADRIATKHLLTLQEGVSVSQFKEMSRHGVRLVIPEWNMKKFPKEVRPELQTLKNFIGEVKILSVRNT